MRKKLYIFALTIVLFVCAQLAPVNSFADSEEVYLGGFAAGFVVDSKGALIIGVNDVITENGIESPSKDAQIKPGDILVSIDGNDINDASDIEKALCDYEGEGITAVIDRGGEIVIKLIYPSKDISGKYRVGLFVRDEVTGIGTITYIKKDLSFAALGHPIVDSNYQRLIKVNSGCVYNCNIFGVCKGEKGKAGEIRGSFCEDKQIGIIKKNTCQGLFGNITDESIISKLDKVKVGNAKPGKAAIYSTVNDTCVEKFDISIVKVDKGSSENKNLVIKITDEKLLNKTNGILQGMSGSPIVQDGNIVGAVTHVFINDPTRGYGIMIDKMLKE